MSALKDKIVSLGGLDYFNKNVMQPHQSSLTTVAEVLALMQQWINATESRLETIEEKPDEVYTTTERKCGTWVDGKALYRRTIIFPLDTTTVVAGGQVYQTNYRYTIDGLGKVVNIVGVLENSNSDNWFPIGYAHPEINMYSNDNYCATVFINRQQIGVRAGNLCGLAQGGTAYITVTYTKTT